MSCRFESTHNLIFRVVSIYLSEIASCITWNALHRFFIYHFKSNMNCSKSIILTQIMIYCVFDMKTFFIAQSHCDTRKFYFHKYFQNFQVKILQQSIAIDTIHAFYSNFVLIKRTISILDNMFISNKRII